MNVFATLSALFALSFISNAQAEVKGIDIYGFLGYKALNSDHDDGRAIDLTGGSIDFSMLYSFPTDSRFKPVLGGSLESVGLSGEKKAKGTYGTSYTLFHKFNYLTLAANGGVKFFATKDFALFGLVNLGHSIYDNYKIDYLLETNKVSVSNHYLYGITAMGAYKLGETFSLGANLIFNKHSMHASVENSDVTKTYNYNENSFNIVCMWSI